MPRRPITRLPLPNAAPEPGVEVLRNDDHMIPIDEKLVPLAMVVSQAAHMLGMTCNAMLRLLHDGEVTSIKIGNKYIITYWSLIQYIRTHQRRGQ
jgi:hypothetical protein